jgi:hypothetical protein
MTEIAVVTRISNTAKVTDIATVTMTNDTAQTIATVITITATTIGSR